ncbi:cell division protein FtsX [Neolewinella antarctica]|uniref:Cell division protein FtsX n=1 Tax=Neolewinella antarctica TaxID=442734 RepID=A0ABX0XCF6_9BACT|nr:hypothetical protein [Neolewinella antarctica]NJC26523.1 cell division transport system permease protein [Neolewinella antarctica]
MHTPNKFYVTVSLALVLFLLGLTAYWAYLADDITRKFREDLDVVVELKADHTMEERRQLLAYLTQSPFNQPLTLPKFLDKEAALTSLDRELASDLAALGLNNPLLDVVTFNVPIDYSRSDSLAVVAAAVKSREGVDDVYYQKGFAEMLAVNARRVTLVVGGVVLLLLVITGILIHNTVRLSLSANRLLIKTQELVGASWGFISRPYLWRAVWQGLLAGLLAAAALSGTWYGLANYLPEIRSLEDGLPVLVICGSITALGVLINFLSYYIGVRRYLRLRIDDLY